MKVCVMKGQRFVLGIGYTVLGIVIGRTLEEAKRKARKKWSWYDSKDPKVRYYAGYPETRTNWMNLD